MIHLKKYQEEAVNILIKNTYRLLKKPGVRHPLVFKAPTGAGKTIMMADYLQHLSEEIPEKTDLSKNKVSYIWIAPNKLYIQSYRSLQRYFEETRCLRPIYFEDINNEGLQPDEILFLNWESINKERNLYVREGESEKSLYSFIHKARMNDIEIIVIIDEEHMFANTKTAKRSGEVLNKISPKIEVRVSATPITVSDYPVTVERQDVISEEMIKEGIILNPAIDAKDEKELDIILIDNALEQREKLKTEYEKLGIDVNPLLLIQLPNDDSESNSSLDESYINKIIAYLEVKGIRKGNQKLAIWLSGQKENLDKIENNNNIVEVLLFKQAIALGWDCPRAGVLLIFRELQSTTFTIQTVGRILRMPEQKYYSSALLNQGYVYTNLSKDIIHIVKDGMSYITMNRAFRIENYQEIYLNSTYINTKIVRNRLGSIFRKTMYEVAEKMYSLSRELKTESVFEHNKREFSKHFAEWNVDKIEISIPENVILTGELEVVNTFEKHKFAKTQFELVRLFRIYCRENIGSFAPVDSTPVLEMTLKYFFEDYFGIEENKAIKLILYPQNQFVINKLVKKSIEKYEELLAQKAAMAQKKVENYQWNVPVERVYDENYLEEKNGESHAMLPFYQREGASNPEKQFALFLEKYKSYFDWWYKNGESGKEHFAIQYTDYMGKESLFYVDFVIKHKSGVICLFDTKTSGSDAANAHLKHNALVEYMEKRNANNHSTIGGIIIGKTMESSNDIKWEFCHNRITNTNDKTGWDFFNPANISAT